MSEAQIIKFPSHPTPAAPTVQRDQLCRVLVLPVIKIERYDEDLAAAVVRELEAYPKEPA